jgi:hypothetical protein
MKSRLVVMAAMLLIAFAGCGKKVDQNELNEANNLIDGLEMLGMMTNVDAYNNSYIMAPPYWEGPSTYPVPEEWEASVYYRWIFALPFDSAGTTIDSFHIYLIFDPDIWDSTFIDSPLVGMDIGLLCDNRDIWFHTFVGIDSLDVSGAMRWNWDETWYSYAYVMSIVPGDTSGEITINTSNDIRLDAHFLFDFRGAGVGEDCWASFDDIIFVRFEFFAAPDEDGYEGYFTLLSEDWKVRHYFPENPPAF